MRAASLALLLALFLPLAGNAATIEATALGGDGTVYRVSSGTYGELFPRGRQLESATPVLALDTVTADSRNRHLVAGTEGADTERTAAVVVDEATGAVFVVWESQHNWIHSRVLLAQRSADGVWVDDPVELSGHSFAVKTGLTVAVTRDELESGGLRLDRMVLHVLWTAEAAQRHAVYTPLVFLDGEYVGASAPVSLTDLDSAGVGADAAAGVASATRLTRPAADRLLFAFTSSTSGRFLVMGARLQPAELCQLADAVEAYLTSRPTASTPTEVSTVAGDLRGHIINLGAAFHPSVRDYLAAEAAVHLAARYAAQPDVSAEVLGADLRGHIINLGIEALGDPLLRNHGRALTLIEVAAQPDPHLLVDLRLIAERSAPGAPRGREEQPPLIFLSRTGAHAIVAWEDEDRFLYRESTVGGWGGIQTLRLGDELDRAGAIAVLEQRAGGD